MHEARTPRRGSRWGSHNGVFSVYIMSHLLLRSFPKEQLVSGRILDAYDPNGPGSSLTFLRALSISTKNYQNKRMKLARIERTTFWRHHKLESDALPLSYSSLRYLKETSNSYCTKSQDALWRSIRDIKIYPCCWVCAHYETC